MVFAWITKINFNLYKVYKTNKLIAVKLENGIKTQRANALNPKLS